MPLWAHFTGTQLNNLVPTSRLAVPFSRSLTGTSDSFPFESSITLSKNHTRNCIGGVSWIPAHPRTASRTKAWERGRRFDHKQKKMIYPSTFENKEPKLKTPSSIFEESIRLIAQENLPVDKIHEFLRQTSAELYAIITGTVEKAFIFVENQIHQGHTAYALNFIEVARQLGHPFELEHFENIAVHLAKAGNWDLVEVITDMSYQTTGVWTGPLLDYAVESYTRTQNFARLNNILNMYDDHGLLPTQRIFHLLIRAHLGNSDLRSARLVLQSMNAAGFVPDQRTYDSILSAYPNIGTNLDVELQALQSIKRSGGTTETSILNNLLKARLERDDVKGAFSLLEMADSPGDNETVDTSSLMSGGIRPDVVTFNTLLVYFAQNRDHVDRFPTVYNLMISAGCRPNRWTVQAILKFFANNTQLDTAVSIMYEHCQRHYSNIHKQRFDIFGEIKDVEVMMNEKFPGVLAVSPSISIFNTFLQITLPYTKLQGLLRILRIFQANDIQLDTATINVVLDHLIKTHKMHPRVVQYVFELLSNFPSYKTSISIKHLNAILSCCIQHEADMIRPGSWLSSARQVQNGLKYNFDVEKRSSDIMPHFDPTAGIAVASFDPRHRLRDILFSMTDILRRRGVLSSRYTFALRIRREAVVKRDLRTAQEVFDIMVSRGIVPNEFHYSHLIEGYSALGSMTEARHTMQLAYSNGIKQNLIFYTMLIIGYGKLGKPGEAEDVFREMLGNNVQPDFAVVDAVVSTYFMVRAYKQARSLLLDVWPFVAPLPPNHETMSLRDLVFLLRSYQFKDKHLPKHRLTIAQQTREGFTMRRYLTKVTEEVQAWQT